MTIAPTFLLVDEHIGRNPVAHAMAKARVISSTRDFCTRLYMLPEGEKVHSDLQSAAKVLAVAIRIAEVAGRIDTPPGRIMRGGMQCLVQLAQRDARWRKMDAAAIDAALMHALDEYSAATAQQTQDAHRFVMSLDHAAMQAVTA